MTEQNYTPAQRFQLAAERMEIERKKLRSMSTTMRMRQSNVSDIMQEVMDIVCKAYAVSEQEVRGPMRLKAVAHARHAYCHLCVKLDPMLTLKQVGETLGRDHSTVINSVRKCDDLRLTDYHFAASFNQCLEAIADSNSKYMRELVKEQLNEDAEKIGDNELKKSVHALQLVHDFMISMTAYRLRQQDGDNSVDDLLLELDAITRKAMKQGF